MSKILTEAICLYDDICEDQIDIEDAFVLLTCPDGKELTCEMASNYSKNLDEIKKNLKEKKLFEVIQDHDVEKIRFICFYGSLSGATKFKEFIKISCKIMTHFKAQNQEENKNLEFEPEIQVTTINSSQELENVSKKDHDGIIIEKLNQIEDLIKEVRSSYLENKRQKTTEKNTDLSSVAKPKVQQVLDKYGYKRKQSVKFSIIPTKDEYNIIKQEMKKKFQVAIFKCRSEVDWLKKIHQFSIDGISTDKMQGIRNILTAGNPIPGYFIRAIARLLFSDEKLMNTKILDPDVKYAGVKAKNRVKHFSEKDEKVLKQILNKIDQELFASKDGWHFLVRCPINQLGLDLRKELKNQNKSSTAEPEIEPVAGPSEIDLDRSYQDPNTDEFVIESGSE